MIREATKEDWPQILRCHQQLEEKLGKKMDLPEFTDRAVLGWWVSEREGQIVQFLYCERAIEICFGGEDVEAVQEFTERAQEILDVSRQAGVRFALCFVPREMPNLGRHLHKAAGFDEQGEMVPYRADLR